MAAGRVSFTSPMTGGTISVPEAESEKYLAAGWVLVADANKAAAKRVVEKQQKDERRAAKKAARGSTPAKKAAKKTTAKKDEDESGEDSAPVPAEDLPVSLTASLPNPDPDAPGEKGQTKASEHTVTRADAQVDKEN